MLKCFSDKYCHFGLNKLMSYQKRLILRHVAGSSERVEWFHNSWKWILNYWIESVVVFYRTSFILLVLARMSEWWWVVAPPVALQCALKPANGFSFGDLFFITNTNSLSKLKTWSENTTTRSRLNWKFVLVSITSTIAAQQQCLG